MDSKVAAELIPPVYEDFDPSYEMVHEKDFDTFLLNLPGFRKDHLKVQLTTSKILRVSGSRLAENNKWKRFQKEFPVTPGRDPQRITAKFEGGILHIKVPMMIPTKPTPAAKKEEKENKSPAIIPPEKLPEDDDQKKDSKEEELPKEKKDERVPEDNRSNINAGGDDDKQKQEDREEAKKSPEDQKNTSDDEKPEGDNNNKTRDLDDIKEKKNVAEDDNEKKEKETDDNKRDKDSSENENPGWILKKHRRMFNLALVTILALAIGIYVSDLFKSLRRRIQN